MSIAPRSIAGCSTSHPNWRSAAALISRRQPTDWNRSTNPWRNLLEGTKAPVPAALEQLGYERPTLLGALRIYKCPQRQKLLIERHPLWQKNHPLYKTPPFPPLNASYFSYKPL